MKHAFLQPLKIQFRYVTRLIRAVVMIIALYAEVPGSNLIGARDFFQCLFIKTQSKTFFPRVCN